MDTTSKVSDDRKQLNHGVDLSGRDERAAQAVKSYLVATPLLWASGLLIPVGAMLLFWLTYIARPWKVLTDPIAAPWYLLGFVQAISVIYNWAQSDLPVGQLFYRLVSTGVSGWIVLGLALGVGRRLDLASAPVVRGVAVLGAYLFSLGSISIILSHANPSLSLAIESPIAKLVPDWLPSRETFFTMRFYTWDGALGTIIPRLILFYPWAVMLGFAGLSVFFIAVKDRSTMWRLLGCTGGLIAVLSSQSRAVVICLAATMVLYFILSASKPTLLVLWVLGLALSVAILLASGYVGGFLSHSTDLVMETRQGSTDARWLGYEASWEAFRESPMLGYGWPGEYLSEGIQLRIGSHSSVYGLLYTGGVISFTVFCYAMIVLIVSLVRRSLWKSSVEKSSLVIACCLVIISYVEGIYSFSLPMLFVFLFIGGTLSPRNYAPRPKNFPF